MEARRALVTGATGYVGSNLVRRMVADGWDMHIIARPTSAMDLLSDVSDRITVHRHDGTIENLHEIVRLSRPDIVFHLASLFLSQHTSKDIERLISSNILFATQLVESLVANGVFRLVNTGTSWQHYENRDYSPVNLYAATKQAFECILQYYVEASGLQVITLKLFDTYGPHDPRPKLLHLLEKMAREGSTLAMSPGDQFIDLVYIDDVVDAFLLAAQRLQTMHIQRHESYTLSSGKPLKLREIVAVYSRVCGKKISIEWGGRPYRQREVMIPWASYATLPTWFPKVSLESGLIKIWQVAQLGP